MERGVIVGIVALRWAAWVWLAAVTLVNLHRVHHPVVAVAAVVLTGVCSAAAHVAAFGKRWQRALAPTIVGVEALAAFAVITADGLVEQARITGQTLPGTWPLAVILLTGVAAGPWWGALTGAVLGGARGLAVVLGSAPPGGGGRAAMAAASTALSWIVIGAVCGAIVRLLRRTQHQLADATARERIARDLHDGVLQTLALIERRSEAPDIARLARQQEVELRSYLFGDDRRPGTLPGALRRSAARLESMWAGVTVTVNTTDDVPSLSDADVDLLTGAVTEAMTNAAKHGGAAHVHVFADVDESDGGLFLSVKDDGAGFDPSAPTTGRGLSDSIGDRVRAAGGTVSVVSSPGSGSEILMRVPGVVASERSARGD